MSEAAHRVTHYKTTNWARYNAALKARGSLTLWLERDMPWLATPSGKRCRQQTFSDASIQFCLSIKCFFNLPSRQTLDLVQSLLQLPYRSSMGIKFIGEGEWERKKHGPEYRRQWCKVHQAIDADTLGRVMNQRQRFRNDGMVLGLGLGHGIP